MTPTISATALDRRYRDQVALEQVSLTVEPATVTGLLGRNGAGKTTLMRIITGQEFPSSGSVRVFGESPAHSDAVLRRMIFVREEQPYPDFRVRHAIKVASWFYPNSWSPISSCHWAGGSDGCRAGCVPPWGSSSGWPPAPT
jgi:ABC-2 type transport system ATP-binding protein